MTVSTVTFMFDADAEGVSSYYGGHFDPAFLKALVEADPKQSVHSRVKRGDALLRVLAEQVKAVSNEEGRSSRTIGHAMDVYKTLVWDMVDAISEQWGSFDIEKISTYIAMRNVHCITLSTVCLEIAKEVDRGLQNSLGYIGALEVDIGNPIQDRVFVEFLIGDALIRDGQIVLEKDWDGDVNTLFENAEEIMPNGVRKVDFGKIHEEYPKERERYLSERGEVSVERFEGKRSPSLNERMLDALSMLWDRRGKRSTFSFEAMDASDKVITAEMPEAKFVQYLLNEEHKVGGGKAKFFADVLGIKAEDWRYLAAQFYEGLQKTDFNEIEIKHWDGGFGANFGVAMPIVGLNGRTAMVQTVWSLKPGQLPQLATAYPADARAAEGVVGSAPPIVPGAVAGDDRWAAMFELADMAGRAAAERHVPTPMKVEGFRQIIMEGEVGYAWVRVPDARTGFAKWLLQSGKGVHHYISGAQIFAHDTSQSFERRRAYANAFAGVLKLNGVDCTVETRLD